MLGLDSETTGLDFKHGTRPFIVTVCDEHGDQSCWEWDVNPLTRKPVIPDDEIEEIQSFIDSADCLVLQNAKFDVQALATIMPRGWEWDWSKVHDTLLAGHLLNSLQSHDLTTMVMVYLNLNVQPFEEKIKTACNEARRLARKKYPDWRIAKKGLEDMPSAKVTVWKYDMWLPRAVAMEEKYAEDHEWWTLCSEYANCDSASTLMLFQSQRELLKEKDLWEIYLERLKILPIVYQMEQTGVTLSRKRLDKLCKEYEAESKRAGQFCLSVAKSYGYKLDLPAGGRNNSLATFIFDVMKLEPYKKSPKTGAPSLDEEVMKYYAENLPPKSKDAKFIKQLAAKRKRDTSLTYMESYRRFWLPLEYPAENCKIAEFCHQSITCSDHCKHPKTEWYKLYPSLNPTGTATLRWSSSNPNEMNISAVEGFNLRYCFGPAPGREWWALDYNNLELRIPAYECGEEEMIRLFEKPDDPPFFGSYHLLVASILHPTLWKLCMDNDENFKDEFPAIYGHVKNGNFADQYGAMLKADGWGTADKAYGVRGGQAKVRKRLSKIALLSKRWIAFANKHGYVETLPDKDVRGSRGYPLYCSRSGWGGISPTIPLSYHVQGTACWVMMRAMIKVQAYLNQLNKKAPNYFMIMQVHDEILLDFPQKKDKGNLRKVEIVQKLMESIGDSIGVSLTCGVDYHAENWSESE